MHHGLYLFLLSWLVGLLALLAFRAIRATRTTDRIVALDTLSYVFIAALAIIAIERRVAGYLDVALMLALLAFAQTVAASRYCYAGKVMP